MLYRFIIQVNIYIYICVYHEYMHLVIHIYIYIIQIIDLLVYIYIHIVYKYYVISYLYIYTYIYIGKIYQEAGFILSARVGTTKANFERRYSQTDVVDDAQTLQHPASHKAPGVPMASQFNAAVIHLYIWLVFIINNIIYHELLLTMGYIHLYFDLFLCIPNAA